MTSIIETHDLTKRFGSHTAVNNISLTIQKGEVFGLLGPNGAGKTTFLSMLCTILKPSSGSAQINGFDIIRESAQVRKSIGIVFQDPSVDSDMTSRENLQMHADLYGVPIYEQNMRIHEVLELVGLSDRADDFMYTYSGGMRRRLEIARGLLHYPRVLFLDEPTIGLDPRSREHIWDYIRELRKREEMTIILTTHYMEEADRLCDRVAIIDKGRIVAMDTPSLLKQEVAGDTIIMGSDQIQNLSDVLIRDNIVKDVSVQGSEIKIFVQNAQFLLPRIVESAVHAGIRIDHITITHPDMNDVFIHYTGKDLVGGEVREQTGRVAMMKRRRAR
ncbi:ATP-binding cassette domain-containing protein [Methanospirillum purgamenti]|jgi:ABC-2 type transport system ATP-binding protein|uniref:ATP-binding cassette domain-containing protein n=1 Tax=Methanospirillum hungatei TaxID=2203 RepID=A0A8F5VN11_METHU|nr:ATP-binding cassette domain-containing protein [Methanospirillum hungatei]QXO95809.1 ATP-binding cassette domain-containing protein [Methanospirillum hungatei]